MKVKIKSFLKATIAGLITGSLFLVIFPFFLIKLNEEAQMVRWDSIYFQSLGLFFIATGLFLFLYCSTLFVRLGEGTPAPIEPPKKLVIKGIYKHTRNPMYLGYFSILLGEFFYFGHFLLFFYFLFIVFFINFYLVFIEEPKLKQRFGSQYEDYINNVPRW